MPPLLGIIQNDKKKSNLMVRFFSLPYKFFRNMTNPWYNGEKGRRAMNTILYEGKLPIDTFKKDFENSFSEIFQYDVHVDDTEDKIVLLSEFDCEQLDFMIAFTKGFVGGYTKSNLSSLQYLAILSPENAYIQLRKSIVACLNQCEESPLYKRLSMDERWFFGTNMIPVITDDKLLGKYLRKESYEKANNSPDVVILKIFYNIFNACKETFGPNWTNLLQQVEGFPAVFNVLPTLITRGQQEKTLTKEYFANYFSKIDRPALEKLQKKWFRTNKTSRLFLDAL
jgi:hypothetical protein